MKVAEMMATSTERELQMKAQEVLENHSPLNSNNSCNRELSMFHLVVVAKCLSPVIRISISGSSNKHSNKRASSKSKKMITMMKIKPTKTHNIYFSSQITNNPTLLKEDLRKAHQGQPSVKVINKMTQKRKAWVWAWATDKVQATM